MMEAGEPPSQPPMEKQQAEPYAGVAVPVNEMQPVAPVPYTGAPLAPVEAVAQESLPLPTMQAFRGARSGSVMHIQLADGRIMAVDVPPGTPPGHQIHFPVAAAPPPGDAPAAARRRSAGRGGRGGPRARDGDRADSTRLYARLRLSHHVDGRPAPRHYRPARHATRHAAHDSRAAATRRPARTPPGGDPEEDAPVRRLLGVCRRTPLDLLGGRARRLRVRSVLPNPFLSSLLHPGFWLHRRRHRRRLTRIHAFTTPLLLRGDAEQSRANSYDRLFLESLKFQHL